MRIDALHNLAIELEHQAQYAVGRRVLRSEIDGEVARRSLAHGGPRFGAPARSSLASTSIVQVIGTCLISTPIPDIAPCRRGTPLPELSSYGSGKIIAQLSI
jgi:hypothetical protein